MRCAGWPSTEAPEEGVEVLRSKGPLQLVYSPKLATMLLPLRWKAYQEIVEAQERGDH